MFVRSRPKTGESGRTRSKIGQNIGFLTNLVIYFFRHVCGSSVRLWGGSDNGVAFNRFDQPITVVVTWQRSCIELKILTEFP